MNDANFASGADRASLPESSKIATPRTPSCALMRFKDSSISLIACACHDRLLHMMSFIVRIACEQTCFGSNGMRGLQSRCERRREQVGEEEGGRRKEEAGRGRRGPATDSEARCGGGGGREGIAAEMRFCTAAPPNDPCMLKLVVEGVGKGGRNAR